MTFNLATILTETALAAPGAPVHLFMGTATTYGQLDEKSDRFAAGLREAGLDPGDVVAMQLPNLPHFLTAYFGVLKAGMVVLPLNPLLMTPELEYHLGDSAAKLLIGFEGMHAEASKACERLGIPLYLVSFGSAPLPDDSRPVGALMGAPTGRSCRAVRKTPQSSSTPAARKPDERLGEEVVAVVALHPGCELSNEEVIAYCRERLAAYKYPREVRFMAELPKGPSGKILKSALRDG